jgi:cysteine-rich repeat protein
MFKPSLSQKGDKCQSCNDQIGFIEFNDICIPLCGDGIIIETEQCDDGNTLSGDGCSFTC